MRHNNNMNTNLFVKIKKFGIQVLETSTILEDAIKTFLILFSYQQ